MAIQLPTLPGPRSGSSSPPSSRVELKALEAGLRAAITGEVRFEDGDRALWATDASNYRQVPLGVVLPRDIEDVVRTVEIARRHRAPVLPRGGGTSLAGQCCNTAVVLDFSKYVNRLLAIDPVQRRARVEPGIVLDELRDAARPHGLTFGPDPATHNRCVIGGMIGNDSCGTHSVMAEFFGPGPSTADQVEELEVLTYDGMRLRVGATPDAELDQIIASGGRRGEIYGRLRELRDRYADLIRARFPKIQRRVSGYNLPALLPENGFNVARALVGSEGTCVTVLEATLTLIPEPRSRVILVLGYPSVYMAGDHVPRIREFRPLALEGIDDHLVSYMRRKGLHTKELGLLPGGNGWLLVEFGGETTEAAEENARHAMTALAREPEAPTMSLHTDPDAQHHLWIVRESGLGATAFIPGEPDTWEGWEDSAVPVEHVGAYLRDLRALLDRYGYRCALYGHFGQGCIHTRIDFDLTSSDGIERYRAFTEEAAEIVVNRYGGSISGEHGDGQARADLLPIMFGAELVEAFREFRAIWDPNGMMNPGKIVDPYPRTSNLRLGTDYRPARPETHFRFPRDGGDFAHAALRCVGVGECRRHGGGTMCPSYMVLREEKHTTRGRAHLFFEMLRGETIRDGWQSEAVKESLDLCLACKGCKGECPVNVDIATYKAEFLSHYYEERPRPRTAFAFGLVSRWARLASMVPGLANFVTQTPGLRGVAKAAAGIAPQRRIPRFARRTFSSWFRERQPRNIHGQRVILWPDTFNNHFFPETLAAATEVLESAGFHVLVPEPFLCCGRPLYDFGLLDRAKQYLRQILAALNPEIEAGTPVVGLEPSCVSVFRDELVNLFPDDDAAIRLSRQTYTLAEALTAVAGGYEPPRLSRRAVVHGHCHQKSVLGFDADQEVLRGAGLDFRILDSGCCGVAGAFGFEKGEKYDVSIAAGERVLLPAIREVDDATVIIADGFSCREQVSHGTGRRALHLAEVLRLALRQGEVDPRLRPEVQHARLGPRELTAPTSAVPALSFLVGGILAGGAAAWYLSRR